MPLEPLTLDDLTWADFVAASLRRIPAASGGRWTLHAPVDPGVTLLELYAWLFDQRLYWMDQVPDALTRALLTLLGISPAPPDRRRRCSTRVCRSTPTDRAGLPVPS